MGTTYKGLYLPATSEVGWQTTINNNFTTIADQQTQFLPATEGRDNNGAACVVFSAFPNEYPNFLLSNGGTTGASWVVRMPGAMASGITCEPIWLASVTDAAAHAPQWQLTVRQLVNAVDVGSGAAGLTDTVTWTGFASGHIGNGAYYDTSATSTGISYVAGNLMRVSIARLGADALDTYLGDCRLLGMTIGAV